MRTYLQGAALLFCVMTSKKKTHVVLKILQFHCSDSSIIKVLCIRLCTECTCYMDAASLSLQKLTWIIEDGDVEISSLCVTPWNTSLSYLFFLVSGVELYLLTLPLKYVFLKLYSMLDCLQSEPEVRFSFILRSFKPLRRHIRTYTSFKK